MKILYREIQLLNYLNKIYLKGAGSETLNLDLPTNKDINMYQICLMAD